MQQQLKERWQAGQDARMSRPTALSAQEYPLVRSPICPGAAARSATAVDSLLLGDHRRSDRTLVTRNIGLFLPATNATLPAIPCRCPAALRGTADTRGHASQGRCLPSADIDAFSTRRQGSPEADLKNRDGRPQCGMRFRCRQSQAEFGFPPCRSSKDALARGDSEGEVCCPCRPKPSPQQRKSC